MITFRRFNADVYVYVAAKEVDNSYTLKITCPDNIQAYALVEYLQKSLYSKLESIRKDAYNQGWKDAKSHKVSKQTLFSGWW